MQSFKLADEFVDIATEQSLLATLVQKPDLYWELSDYLAPDVFIGHSHIWKVLAQSIEAEQFDHLQTFIPAEWIVTTDPEGAAKLLADLYQRRLLAHTQERLAGALYNQNTPASQLVTLLEEELAQVQLALRESQSSRLLSADDLLTEVLADAEQRLKQRLETGQPVTGIPTGLAKLDEMLGGLSTGLYILAGSPGVGKTTLSLQMSLHAVSQGIPVIYISYENSPVNLVLKALCTRAKISPNSVERGFVKMSQLEQAASELRPMLSKLAIIEGTSRLTIAQVRGKALRLLAHHKANSCLVVLDYLQRAAQSMGFEQLRHSVSSMAGELRELSSRLNSPVLVLSSQNRSSGDYGKGGGSSNLDSLKESGDLEYAADVVMFLKDASKDRGMLMPPLVPIDLVVAKNRFGAKGSLSLVFRSDIGDMREEVIR
jgi:replicative DNA helicase